MGQSFVQQYTQIFNNATKHLHRFYTELSTFSHSDKLGETETVFGQQDIHNKTMALEYEDCTMDVTSGDSQYSHQGGVIIVITGVMKDSKAGTQRAFAQTFFLLEQSFTTQW